MSPEQYNELRERMDGIFKRLDILETKISERCERRMCQMVSLEKRIRHLELRSAMLTGGLVVVPVIINWLLKFI